MKPLLLAAVGGVLLGLSLPPFDLWFLAPVAYGLLAFAVVEGSRRARFLRTGAFFLVYFVIGLFWSIEFAAAAFPLLVLVEVLLTSLPVLVSPKAPRLALLALPALLTLGELVRYRFPLGGLPLAGPALGQVNGPVLVVSRLAGDMGIVFVTALAGVALFALWRHRALGIGAAVVVLAAGLAGLLLGAPNAVEALRVAYAQGGGPRGLSAAENTLTDVFGNQVEAHRRVEGPVDLVVWPEDVVDLPGPIAQDDIRREIGALAAELETTLVAGVVEDSGETRFRNAAVAWDRSGKIVDRYEKVHRVPFGEYIPLRSLVSRIADVSAVPRDAIAGKGDGVLLTRAGELGVLISFEVFFADRARAAVSGGAEILLVPTNASSFRGEQVPAQEVAAARLRAVETGRDLIQSAPTGYSLFVDANGTVSRLSELGAQAAATTTLHTRHGKTPYARTGDRPIVAVVLILAVAAIALDRSVKSTG